MESYQAFDKHLKQTNERLKKKEKDELERQKQEFVRWSQEPEFRSRMSTGNIH